MLPSPTKLRSVSGMKLVSAQRHTCPRYRDGLYSQYQRDQHHPRGDHQEPED